MAKLVENEEMDMHELCENLSDEGEHIILKTWTDSDVYYIGSSIRIINSKTLRSFMSKDFIELFEDEIENFRSIGIDTSDDPFCISFEDGNHDTKAYWYLYNIPLDF